MQCKLRLQDIKEVANISKADEITISAKEKAIIGVNSTKNKEFIVLKFLKELEGEDFIILSKRIITMLNDNEVEIKGNRITSGNREIYVDNEIGEITPVSNEELELLAKVKFKEFKEALEITYAVDRTSIRAALSGIWFDENMLVAIDGYRLAKRTLSESAKEKIFIPYHVVQALRKIKRGKDSSIEIYGNEVSLIFKIDNFELICSKESHSFVNWRELIQQEKKIELKIDAKELYRVVKQYQVGRFETVLINLKREYMNLSSKMMGFKVKDKINIDFIEQEFEVLVRSKYLSESLKSYKGEVNLIFNTPVSPILITQNTKLDMVLPIRIIKGMNYNGYKN